MTHRNTMQTVTAAGTLALIALLAVDVTEAALCPLCGAPTLTLSEQVFDSDHVVLAKWVSGTRPNDESFGDTKFEVVVVRKSRKDRFGEGTKIKTPQFTSGRPGDLYVLTGFDPIGAEEVTIDWQEPMAVNDAIWKYLSNTPSTGPIGAPAKDRLTYFLDWLENPELIISNDAYAELANAPYDDVVALKDKLPREKLRKWLTSPDTPITRIALYGLMLGICGDESDAKILEDRINDMSGEYRLGIEGVMGGYLLLTKQDGLRMLAETRIRATTYVTPDGETKDLPFSEKYAAVQALRFLWTYEPDLMPKEELKKAMRLVLQHHDMADLAIPDLARWKDWEIQDQLVEMFADKSYHASVRRAILRFVYTCSKDIPKDADPDQLPDHVKRAEENLKKLKELDPNLYESALRSVLPGAAVIKPDVYREVRMPKTRRDLRGAASVLFRC